VLSGGDARESEGGMTATALQRSGRKALLALALLIACSSLTACAGNAQVASQTPRHVRTWWVSYKEKSCASFVSLDRVGGLVTGFAAVEQAMGEAGVIKRAGAVGFRLSGRAVGPRLVLMAQAISRDGTLSRGGRAPGQLTGGVLNLKWLTDGFECTSYRFGHAASFARHREAIISFTHTYDRERLASLS
jgi:hypothetical protein